MASRPRRAAVRRRQVPCALGIAASPGRGDRASAGHPGELVRGERLLRSARGAVAPLVRMGIRGRRQRHEAPMHAPTRRGGRDSRLVFDSARGRCPRSARPRPTIYGVRDLHGVVWEWVEDAGSMLVSVDSREQGDPDRNVLRRRRAELRTEGELRHADAHRDAVEHEGGLQLDSMGFRCASDDASTAMMKPRADALSVCGPARHRDRRSLIRQRHFAVSAARNVAEPGRQAINLDLYRGHPVMVTMFYATCPATCPLIIDTLRAVERDSTRRSVTCAC